MGFFHVQFFKFGGHELIENIGNTNVKEFVLMEWAYSWVGEGGCNEFHVLWVKALNIEWCWEIAVNVFDSSLNKNFNKLVNHELSLGKTDLIVSNDNLINVTFSNVNINKVFFKSSIHNGMEVHW